MFLNDDKDLGYDLIKHWKNSRKLMSSGYSEIYFYNIKQKGHTSEDSFFQIKKLFIDTEKKIRTNKNRTGGPEMKITKETFIADCSCSSDWMKLSVPLQMNEIRSGISLSSIPKCDTIIDETVLLVSRDGCSNIFHGMADIINAYMMKIMFDYKQIIIIDDFEKGPLWPLWSTLTDNKVEFICDMNEPFLLENCIFSPPGGTCFIWKSLWKADEEMRQARSPILNSFRNYILEKYRISYPPITEKTIIIASRKGRGNETGSCIANEKELTEKIADSFSSQKLKVQCIEFSDYSFEEQILLAAHSRILIGSHGAANIHCLWMEPGSTLLEIFPMGISQTGYGNISNWSGLNYISWFNTDLSKEINYKPGKKSSMLRKIQKKFLSFLPEIENNKTIVERSTLVDEKQIISMIEKFV